MIDYQHYVNKNPLYQQTLSKSGRIGNAENFRTAINAVKRFSKGKDFHFEEINYKWLTDFEAYHYSRGNSPISLSVYLQSAPNTIPIATISFADAGYVIVETDNLPLETTISKSTTLPESFSLSNNFPNHGVSTATGQYNLPEESAIKISIYTSSGRLVTTLVYKKRSFL